MLMRRYGACLLPVEAWRSLVARLLREQEVVGSSPVASTNVETRLFCKESAFLRTLFAFLKNFLHYFISSMTTTLSKGVTNDDFETLFPETDKT